MSSIDERRRLFAKYKEDVKTRGKPFFPNAMFHDTVMSLVVVCIIIVLAIVWHETADGTKAGLLGKEYDDKADSGTFSFVPRPDWYFYFLFYLLRIFKWPDSVILGTIGIPTIALLLLIALPFIDVRAERRPLRRPVATVGAILAVLSMGVLTYKGATAKETLGTEELANVPTWAAKEGFATNKVAVKGAQLFALSGCLNCHTYNGSGGHNLGAPDLSAEGAKRRGIKFQVAHLECPSCVRKGSPMPSFKNLGPANLEALATFLEASRGAK